MDIMELENKRIENEGIITQLIKENKGIVAEIHKQKWGVAPGIIVVDKTGARFVVKEVQSITPNTKPWVVGHPFKRDGSRSIAIRNLYTDWELSPEV